MVSVCFAPKPKKKRIKKQTETEGKLTDDCKVLDLVGDAVEHLILSHTRTAAISAKPDDYQALFFAKDSLVDMPAGLQVWQYETRSRWLVSN